MRIMFGRGIQQQFSKDIFTIFPLNPGSSRETPFAQGGQGAQVSYYTQGLRELFQFTRGITIYSERRYTFQRCDGSTVIYTGWFE